MTSEVFYILFLYTKSLKSGVCFTLIFYFNFSFASISLYCESPYSTRLLVIECY